MFGDNPFAVPISSFQRPVPLVLVDPDDEPDYNVCFRKEWLPYILGSLQQLWLQTTWDTTDPDALALAQSRAKLLTSLFITGCPTCEADIPKNSGCVKFGTDSRNSIISYAPQDPFVTPDYIPPGYIAVPFLVANPGDPISYLPGVEIGDVYSGYLSFPVTTPSIGEGLARFRVHVSGTGVVELHLLRIPSGGSVLITSDDDPLTVRTINLNKDIFQLPAETVGEVVVEVPITTPGEHHVDVTFVPRFNDELIFVSYGGGLRSVVLCGFDKTINEVTEARATQGAISLEIEDEMRLRVDPDRCWVIQNECSPGVWEDWYDPTCAGAMGSPDVQPPAGGTVELDECLEYNVTLRANERWRLPVAVAAGYTVEITGASGGWSDGTANWFCPNGQVYVLGACTDIGAGVDAGDPIPTLNHMRLIAKIDAAYFDAYNQTITIAPGITDSELEFQANDSTLGDNSGSISFHVRVCNAAKVRETITVLMTTWLTPPTSFNTNPDKMYKLTFSGTGFPDNPDLAGDAFYTSADAWATHGRTVNANVCTGFLDVACDCTPFATIPPYSADHVYVVYRPGTGAPFTIIYADDFYGDNSGTLTCVVEEL